MYKYSGKLNHLSFEETESRHRLIGQISDKIINIIAILSFSARKAELKKLDEQISNDFLPKQIKVYKYSLIGNIISGIFFLIMMTFFLLYMVHLRINNLISVGDFTFVFGIAIVIIEETWAITMSMQDFARNIGDLRSSISLLYTPQIAIDKTNAKILKIKDPKIEFNNVSFGYNNDDGVFKNLDLHIKAGEKVGLVDGQDISSVTQDSLRENIAVIPQDMMLFHRTLFENIKYGRGSATDEKVIEASKAAHIHEFTGEISNLCWRKRC